MTINNFRKGYELNINSLFSFFFIFPSGQYYSEKIKNLRKTLEKSKCQGIVVDALDDVACEFLLSYLITYKKRHKDIFITYKRSHKDVFIT